MKTSGAAAVRTKSSYETRIPEAPKYAHVTSKLDVGRSVAKVKPLTNRQMLKRRDEIFLRISRDELAELLEEYEKLDEEHVNDNAKGGYENGPRICVYEEEAKVEYERPYLILDVRTPEEYGDCHMLQARSMPQRLLMQDKHHPDIYRFRNHDSKLIVLYDDGERLAAAAAHILVHRGFDNVYVVSGGLVRFAERFPRLVEGDASKLPEPEGDTPRKPGARSANTTGANMSSARSSASSAMTLRHGGGSQHGGSQAPPVRTAPRGPASSHGGSQGGSSRFRPTPASLRARDDDQLSRMSELSLADSVISRCTARKARM